jgi:hypothetical protein
LRINSYTSRSRIHPSILTVTGKVAAATLVNIPVVLES